MSGSSVHAGCVRSRSTNHSIPGASVHQGDNVYSGTSQQHRDQTQSEEEAMERLGCESDEEDGGNNLNRFRWTGKRKCERRYEPNEAARKELGSSEQKDRDKNMAAMLDKLNERDGVRT